eukprot:CAMPEP_0170864322 /NCGR_PEP_ID=MMETSP0734-20130129/20401_1 /TAXON_ID=186038 /ORGANISM="Fragilariopsis kerguelensis, Strain L26-C5" /LENGTH=84 /DNA_ID=CAMNT_0011239893 /DNA_START=1080 /DNA_END=1331 /DNA_ORIENTATION=-
MDDDINASMVKEDRIPPPLSLLVSVEEERDESEYNYCTTYGILSSSSLVSIGGAASILLYGLCLGQTNSHVHWKKQTVDMMDGW